VALFRSRTLDRELDEELRTHVDLAIEENLQRGMSRNEARSAALRAFGGVSQIRDTYRMRRGIPVLENVIRDIRFGARQLLRSAGFTITAVLTLAIGIGANTAVFSLVNGLLLRPLPTSHPDELALIHVDRSDDGDYGPNYTFNAKTVRALELQTGPFQSVAGFTNTMFQVQGGPRPFAISGAFVSGQFFRVIDTPPLFGRYFIQANDGPEAGSPIEEVVISYAFWRRWFSGDPNVIGRQLVIANSLFTVIGVMPEYFVGADPTRRAEIYAPLASEPIIDAPYNRNASGYRWLRVIARRRQDVTLEQSRAALGAATTTILQESGLDSNTKRDALEHHVSFSADSGMTGYSRLRSIFRKPVGILFAICASILLLACMNLASLILARSYSREYELATRMALGGSRFRIIQQLLIESALISILGTLVGLMAAPMVSRLLAAFVVAQNRGGEAIDPSVDLKVLAFTGVLAILSTLLIGVLPAVRSTSGRLDTSMRSGGRTISNRTRPQLLSRALLTIEVALALTLVVGAGLLVSSLGNLYETGLGFAPKGVMSVELDIGKQPSKGAQLLNWYEEFEQAVSKLPGVQDVSFASNVPLNGHIWTEEYKTEASNGDRELYVNSVAPGYFSTMRIPIMAGRDFRWTDNQTTNRKIILSRSAAKYLFAGDNPLGKKIKSKNIDYEVIGIAGETRYASIRETNPAGTYIPITQSDDKKQSYTALVRVAGNPASFLGSVSALTGRIAPQIPVPTITRMTDVIDSSISSERMMAILGAFFAICALLVTGIGLYGTLAYSTGRRTREIGLRMAVGAGRSEILCMILAENGWVAASGSVLGLVLALMVWRVLANFLYGLSAHDSRVVLASAAALTIITSLASVLPAFRASRIEPTAALRSE
jgi:predicted permease